MFAVQFRPRMNDDLSLRPLDPSYADRIVELAGQLNTAVASAELHRRLMEAWNITGYHCLGLFKAGVEQPIGISSAWITTRLYGGKLVELDNVIIDPEHRGVGGFFMEMLEAWAVDKGCKRMELKTYVANARSHKYYFNHGFDIRAFYFVKQVIPITASEQR